MLYFERKIIFHKGNNFAMSGPFSRCKLHLLVLSSSLWTAYQGPEMPTGWEAEAGQVPASLPVTRSSAVLVACPDPLVAFREYRPLWASATAGIVSLARPSLKEICTPGRVEVEITWPSRNQLTSGTGKPGAQRQVILDLSGVRQCPLFCSIMLTALS